MPAQTTTTVTANSLALCLLLLLVTSAFAQTSSPSDVHVKLSLASTKSVYRMGEPIKLIMEFTADREGYIVEVLPNAKERGTILLLFHPRYSKPNKNEAPTFFVS